MDDYRAGSAIRQRYELLKPVLDERRRRLWAAAEALVLGTGGVSMISGVTGLSRTTIRAGIEELRSQDLELAQPAKEERVRRPGAGRKAAVERDETLERDLKTLLESSQEEESCPLDWTCKSLRGLAEELSTNGHRVSYRTVGNLLHRMGYCFSPSESYKKFSIVNRRDQYRLISRRSSWFLRNGEPVVSVGLSAGAAEGEGLKHQQPVRPERRTADLAASVLRHWWRHSSARRFPRTRRLLVIADTSGLPAGDQTIWAPLLQPLADESGLQIIAAHFPPGARRWRRSVREVTTSFSRPGTRGAGELLTVDLDLILPSGSEMARRIGVRHNPGEAYDGFWNYRIDSRPEASAG